MKHRIAVIGGGGFIGSRLIDRLARTDHTAFVIDRSARPEGDVEFRSCDVCDRDRLIESCAGADVIVHLAAEHRDDVQPVSRYTEVNVQGTENVCAAARAAGIRKLVFTSSVAVYGFTERGRPLAEDAPARPFNEYGRTKYLAEQVLQKWFEEDPGRSLVIMRPTVVFGERNRGNVYNLLRQIVRGPFLMIGNGSNRKSMAYVENVAAALEFSLGLGAGTHLFNYVDKPDYDMNQLVALIRSVLGDEKGVGLRLPYSIGLAAGICADGAAWLARRPLPFSRVRVEKFCASTEFAADRIRALGFRPPVDLQDALRRTIEFEFGSVGANELEARP
jgi:nucleoside-diphosphate-sugar epimerase